MESVEMRALERLLAACRSSGLIDRFRVGRRTVMLRQGMDLQTLTHEDARLYLQGLLEAQKATGTNPGEAGREPAPRPPSTGGGADEQAPGTAYT